MASEGRVTLPRIAVLLKKIRRTLGGAPVVKIFANAGGSVSVATAAAHIPTGRLGPWSSQEQCWARAGPALGCGRKIVRLRLAYLRMLV